MPEPRQSRPGKRAQIASERIARLAAKQRDVFSHAQLERCGLSPSAIVRWTQSGRLCRVYPGVFALGHRPRGYESDLVAALIYLGPGAALSHLSALWWWGLLAWRPRTIHISATRRRRRLGAIWLHRPRELARVFHNDLPVTPVPQALLDSAPLLAPNELRKALAQAEFKRLLHLDEIEAVLGKGHRGSTKLRAALHRHLPQLASTKSDLEDAFLFLCERHLIPIPEVNEWIAGWEVHASWPELGVAVELDGVGNHGHQVAVARDRRKELALRTAGLTLLRYSTEQVERHEDAVAADVIDTLRTARRRAA